MTSIDDWYLQNLVCPVDQSDLRLEGRFLISEGGRRYPIVDGVPVLLVADQMQTIGVARGSIGRAEGRPEAIDQRAPHLYLESLGISDEEKEELVRLSRGATTSIDPVVMMLVGATCGNAYKDLIGARSLKDYPIPSLALTPNSANSTLLDIGCNWGRWSFAAARRGFSVTGIDPSLGAVMAARRIAKDLNLDIKFLVADGRFLPFRDNRFDAVYSYSVLQHLSKNDARKALAQVGRVLQPGGVARIQMAAKWGVRSIEHQARRKFREPSGFEVRYWTIRELKAAFSDIIGRTQISADWDVGWQWSDFRYVSGARKVMLTVSELLRRVSIVVAPVRMVADSVFCTATKVRSP